jgi:hypothetical protein
LLQASHCDTYQPHILHLHMILRINHTYPFI